MSAGLGPEATERSQQLAERDDIATGEVWPDCPRTFLGIECQLPAGHVTGHRARDTGGSVYGWSDALSD